MNDIPFNERLRAAREMRRQSQHDLAYALGCYENTVWRWEAGRAKPMGLFMRQIEKIYPEVKGE